MESYQTAATLLFMIRRSAKFLIPKTRCHLYRSVHCDMIEKTPFWGRKPPIPTARDQKHFLAIAIKYVLGGIVMTIADAADNLLSCRERSNL